MLKTDNTGKKQVIFFLLFFLTACTIRIPRVNITGELTDLEKQVLGSYKRLEMESRSLTSYSTSQFNQSASRADNNNPVLQALKNRQLDRAKIDSLKRLGIVGENNKGYLEIVDSSNISRTGEPESAVRQIVQRENSNRKVIRSRIVAMNAPANRKQIEAVVAKIIIGKSAKGTWIQSENGNWVKKK